MRRRTLLATAAALLSTGCNEVVPDDLVPGDPTATPTDTPANATGTPTPTDTPTRTERTERPTDTPTTPERNAARRIEAARGHLADALATYVGFADGEDPTLLDMTMATPVSPAQVIRPVSDARRTLEALPAGASAAQQTTAQRLLGVAEFLAQSVHCHAALRDARDEVAYIVGRLYAEQSGGLPSDVAQLRTYRSNAADRLAAIESNTSADQMSALEGLGADTWDAKVAQFRQAIAAIGVFADSLPHVRRGFTAFNRAASAYANRAYGTAVAEFRTTENELQSAKVQLEALDAPPALEEFRAHLVADCADMAAAAADFRRAAEAGSRGLLPPQDAVAAGKDHLRDASQRVREFSGTVTLLRQ